MTTSKKVSHKTVEINLHLSGACAKYLQANMCEGTTEDAIQLKKGLVLSEMIEMCIEPRSLGWKSAEFDGDTTLMLQLQDMKWRNSFIDTRYKHYWISPDRMKRLDGIISRIMRHEMVATVFSVSEKHEKQKKVHAIREFLSKYGLTESDLSEENAIKIYQRATDCGKKLNISKI